MVQYSLFLDPILIFPINGIRRDGTIAVIITPLVVAEGEFTDVARNAAMLRPLSPGTHPLISSSSRMR